MKTIRLWILGLIIFTAVVLAGLVFLQLASKPAMPANVEPIARHKVQPSRAETVTPSPPSLAQAASPSSAAAKSSVPTVAPVQLWATPNETRGEKLDRKSTAYIKARREGVKLQGRSALFDPGSLTSLAALQRGDKVVIPLVGGEQVTGKINLVQQEAGGWVRIGGELTGPRIGSFSLGSSGKKVGGRILLPQEEIAYAITEQRDGQMLMQEKHLSEVICFPIPRPKHEPVAVLRKLAPQEIPPILSSRPTATAVLYLDFDGETVTDPDWNGGTTIVALPSSLNNTQITEVWNRVKEDYWPFNIDVTTDLSRYNNAPVGSRMRCIITPTDTAAPGAGGVAYTHSFAKAGDWFWFSSTIPCWVFNSGVVGVAEAVSHELGHTLGLSHDGRTSPVEDYYEGHGSGAVSWAPIMGVGYYVQLVQWSKGEYLNANNQEDDLAIIANAANGFGLIADEAGNSRGSATALNAPGGSVNQTGIITGASDVDFYIFTVGAAYSVSINANPASISPDLDILLELQNSTGTVLAISNPDTALNAVVSYNVAAGTYYIKVQGTGRGDVLGDGYSNYGSIGYYLLNGSIGSDGLPTLAGGSVSPSSGTPSYTFVYTVNYNDSSGQAPQQKYVYIDGTAYIMTRTSGSDANGTYTYQKGGLSVSTHNYYFQFRSGGGVDVRYPASGSLSGPQVASQPPQPGNKISIVSGGYDWDDSNGSGDGDGVIETEEDIDLQVKLKSTVALDYIMGTLSSSDGDLIISHSEKQYPPVSAGGSVWPYSSWDLLSNPTSTRSVPFSLYVEYNYGDQDYYQTFTLPNKTFYENGTMDASFAVLSSYTIDDSTAINSDNNGDGIIQSGETVKIRPKLRNTGQAGATDIEAWLTYDGTAFSFNGPSDAESYPEDYPDLGAGDESYPSGADSFRIDDVRQDFTGTASVDFHMTYDQSASEVVLPGAVEVNIQPAAWIRLSEETFDFGVATPGSSVIHTVLVQNVGSASLQVTNITTSAADTTNSGFALPCTISAGQTTSLVVQINTTGLQGQISRQIRAYSTGRVHGEHDLFTMSGLVSDTVPVNQIPGVTGGHEPDISGSWIVWADSSSGNNDIYAFNTDTEQKLQITTDTNSQFGAKISSNLVFWSDRRVSPTSSYYDVYAYDFTRPDLGNFPVAPALSAGRSRMFGADSNLVAFTHIYEYLDDGADPIPEYARNLHVMKYIGNGQFINQYTTGYSPGSGNADRPSVTDSGDFNEGLIVFGRDTQYLNANNHWSSKDQHYEVLDFLVGDTSPRILAGNFYRMAAAAHRFVHIDESADGDDAIWMWRTSGANQQLFTVLDHDLGGDSHAIGGPDGQDIIAYDDDERPGLFYIDRAAGDAESLIKATGDCDDLRADGYGLVWVNKSATEAIEYCFLKQPDVQVTSPGITFSADNPVEGEEINISVLVRNLSAYNQTGIVTVALSDGDPDAGGTVLASSQSFAGLSANTDRTVTFSNITSLVEGQHSIFAKLTVTASDPGNNNKASRTLTVQDSDTLPPTISRMIAAEHNGDGDGIIGTDENIRISWTLADASGIGSTTATVDGSNATVQGTYYADLGKLAVGTHSVTVTAVDADSSPESSQRAFTFSVVPCEAIAIFFGSTSVSNGTTSLVNLGLLSQNISAAPACFIVRNNGEQTLVLGQLSVGAPFTKNDPGTTTIVPSSYTTFDLVPDTFNAGVFTSTVTLVNSDALKTPFIFKARYEVHDLAPTDMSLSSDSVPENQPSGTVVGVFSTTDPNPGDTFTCSLVIGTGSEDNGSFTINGSTLKTAASFNYEVKNSYSIRVRSTDQTGLWYEKIFTIQVNNENETPTDISLSNSSVAEEQPFGTVVGTFGTTDPDSGNTFTYSLVSGTGGADNSSFAINGSTLKTAVSFDYEIRNSYSIRIRSTDQGSLWAEKVFTITIRELPEAPTGVSASDGTYTDKVRVTWNASSGATSYEVWRYTSNSSGSASKISSPDPTGTNYDDMSATAGITYYYWVKAVNAVGTSEFSTSDTGQRSPAVVAPSAPTGVSASDGMYSNKVQVTWNAVSEATSYEVWRNTANDSGAAGKLADVALSLTAEERESLTLRDTENQLVLAPRVASPAYDDTSAFAKVTYYYWVKTKRASDVSEFSQSDSGYRKAGLPPPASVVASDGTYSNKVRIVWPIVTDATSYEVWRAAVNAAGFAALLGEVGGLEGNDTTAQLGTVYYYWVKSKNAMETSAFSLSDSGYCSREVNIQPKVTINGVSGEVALRKSDTLSVAVFLMATSGLNADWWLVAATPFGWYYYDVYSGAWVALADMANLHPSYQGALFDFLAPIELLNMSTYWLPTGAYVFYFGVDRARPRVGQGR